MTGIPAKCPNCGSQKQWKERINPITSGIPLGNDQIRFRFLRIRGLGSGWLKEKLGYYTVRYRCHKCGYQGSYELPHL